MQNYNFLKTSIGLLVGAGKWAKPGQLLASGKYGILPQSTIRVLALP